MCYNINMKYKTINIKENHPTVELALAKLELEIEVAHFEGCKVIKVIHGYGSNGVGGDIKKNLSFYLMQAKRKGFIKDYIKGEELSTSKILKDIQQTHKEIYLDNELFFSNPGITIIIL